MSDTREIDDREPSTIDAALSWLESSSTRRPARRVTLDEIVEVIRSDREASHR